MGYPFLLQQVQGNDYDELAFLAQFGLVLRLSLPRERLPGYPEGSFKNAQIYTPVMENGPFEEVISY